MIIKNGELPENFLKEGLEIFIGGDVRYGFGRIQLVNEPKDYLLNNSKDLDKWQTQSACLAVETHCNKVNGKIELLVDIERPWEGAELKVKLRQEKSYFYMPGSIINQNLNNYKMIKGILVK